MIYLFATQCKEDAQTTIVIGNTQFLADSTLRVEVSNVSYFVNVKLFV